LGKSVGVFLAEEGVGQYRNFIDLIRLLKNKSLVISIFLRTEVTLFTTAHSNFCQQSRWAISACRQLAGPYPAAAVRAAPQLPQCSCSVPNHKQRHRALARIPRFNEQATGAVANSPDLISKPISAQQHNAVWKPGPKDPYFK